MASSLVAGRLLSPNFAHRLSAASVIDEVFGCMASSDVHVFSTDTFLVQNNCHDESARTGPSVLTGLEAHSLTGNVQQVCIKRPNGAYQPLTYPGSSFDFALRYGENANPFPERSVVYENGYYYAYEYSDYLTNSGVSSVAEAFGGPTVEYDWVSACCQLSLLKPRQPDRPAHVLDCD